MRRPCALALTAALVPACSEVLDLPDVHAGDCSPDAAFTEVAPVPGLEAGAVQSGHLSRDELTIVFSQMTTTPVQRYGDLYIAHRDHVGDQFANVRALDEVNTDVDELTASLSDDRLTLYFDREVADRQYQIFAATRQTAEDAFGFPVEISLGDAKTSNFEPFISDGLYFGSTRNGGIASLFMAPGAGTQFGRAQRLASLETVSGPTAYENPVVSADGLTIYFAAAPDAASRKDIWTAHRVNAYAPFDAPRLVTSVNTPASEAPDWISSDGCRLYFSTTRDGSPALWLATRRR